MALTLERLKIRGTELAKFANHIKSLRRSWNFRTGEENGVPYVEVGDCFGRLGLTFFGGSSEPIIKIDTCNFGKKEEETKWLNVATTPFYGTEHLITSMLKSGYTYSLLGTDDILRFIAGDKYSIKKVIRRDMGNAVLKSQIVGSMIYGSALPHRSLDRLRFLTSKQKRQLSHDIQMVVFKCLK